VFKPGIKIETRKTGAIFSPGRLILIIFLGWSTILVAQTLFRLNFQSDEIGKLPSGWISWDEKNAARVYSVQAENGKRFLHADSKGSRDQLGYEHPWALREFPLLQWQWRPAVFPVNSNEREKSRNDSVLGLYVIFGHWPFIKTIKYIWSDTLPAGTIFTSPYSSTTKIVVVRSGRTRQGTWVNEKRNVLSDYHELYGEAEKAPLATGIAVLTDSDDTRSHAVGDYADIQVLTLDGNKSGSP
jgi:Protein of unknown function (DUF3047)